MFHRYEINALKIYSNLVDEKIFCHCSWVEGVKKFFPAMRICFLNVLNISPVLILLYHLLMIRIPALKWINEICLSGIVVQMQGNGGQNCND